MKYENKPPLWMSFLEGLFVSVPVRIANFILKKLYGINRKSGFKIFALSIIGWLLSFGLLVKAYHLLRALAHSDRRIIPLIILASYGIYLILSLPFFILLSYGTKNKEEKLLGLGESQKRRIIRHSDLKRGREKSSKTRAFLGTSFWNGRGFYLTDEMRKMHTHVVGSTGVGKTESVLLSLADHDIRAGKGAVIIDAKGDLELLARLRQIVHESGRDKDFLFFSLSHPEISSTYNPLLRGNASEIKDKLIGATEWREEFYRKKAEEALLTLLRPMVSIRRKIKFRDLYHLLTGLENLRTFKNEVNEGPMYYDLEVMERRFSDNYKFLSGIIADLALVTKSEFARLVDVDRSEIDLLKVYEEGKIVYFSLNTQGYEETAKRFGRLVLQDIKTVSNEIQTQKEESKRQFFPVFIDEFSSFAYENFIEFLNKGRGAGFAITLLHQSLGDLAAKRTTFQQQIIENTNIKILMRQDDPFSIEKFAKIGGARKTLVSTYQTEERILGTGFTGVGSIREGQTFRVNPDLVRALGVGEAIVIVKSPKFEIDYLKLNYERKTDLRPLIGQIRKEKEDAFERIEKGGPDTRFKTLKDKQREFQREKETRA